jgi:HSP20 family protein
MRFTAFYPQTALQKFFDDDIFASDWIPSLDITEQKEQYIIKVDLPGLQKDNIKITLESGVLRIEGERKAQEPQQDTYAHRSERSYGRFVRAIKLGAEVDANKLSATYKDGVLEVTVGKTEQVKPKAIDIQIG